MYSQVQVLIPIHGNTIECVVKINFVFKVVKLKNYFRVNNVQNNRIGTCITYLTDSDTIKTAGIGQISIQIPGIGTALFMRTLIYIEGRTQG